MQTIHIQMTADLFFQIFVYLFHHRHYIHTGLLVGLPGSTGQGWNFPWSLHRRQKPVRTLVDNTALIRARLKKRFLFFIWNPPIVLICLCFYYMVIMHSKIAIIVIQTALLLLLWEGFSIFLFYFTKHTSPSHEFWSLRGTTLHSSRSLDWHPLRSTWEAAVNIPESHMIITLRIIRHLKSMVLSKVPRNSSENLCRYPLTESTVAPSSVRADNVRWKSWLRLTKPYLMLFSTRGWSSIGGILSFPSVSSKESWISSFSRGSELHDFQIIADKINFFFSEIRFPIQIAHNAIIGWEQKSELFLPLIPVVSKPGYKSDSGC